MLPLRMFLITLRMGFRYIGSKTRILFELMTEIHKYAKKEGHICDLMCGTGAVSAELRKGGYKVTAVDIMSQSYHHTQVQLFLDSAPGFESIELGLPSTAQQNTIKKPLGYDKVINTLNNLEPVKGYFWREFSPDGAPSNGTRPRKYFSSENAKRIDAVRGYIAEQRKRENVSDLEYSLLIHDLIMAANDVANIAGTYGHYLSKFVNRALQPIFFKKTKFMRIGSTEGHKVLQGPAEEFAGEISCDLCYIDPPYMKRQYAANYHILETLARGDEPEAIGLSGLRPWRDQYSNFCSKLKIRNSFSKIFSDMDCTQYLISYSEDGLLSEEELLAFLEGFGEVDLHKFSNKRFKSNDSRLKPNLNEYLLHLKLS